uniref:Uncharacterized protein n=1 Tax=viral metagenome TaxID=1070528 RepID=A0A6M3JZH8_9ZZZZ
MSVKEIEAKQVQLEAELTTALEAAKVLTPATAEFDEAYGRYLSTKAAIARIPDEIAKAKLAENKEAIDAAGITVAEGIFQLVDRLKVAELLGSPVIALRYYRTTSKDEQGAETISTGVAFNPVTKASSTGPREASAKSGRTVIVDAQGNRISLTKFALEYASDEEKAKVTYKTGVTPHVLVDSKPKFEAFCKAHNLTGYTYEAAS